MRDVKRSDPGEAIGRKGDEMEHELIQRCAVRRSPGQMFEVWTFGNEIQLSKGTHAYSMEE